MQTGQRSCWKQSSERRAVLLNQAVVARQQGEACVCVCVFLHERTCCFRSCKQERYIGGIKRLLFLYICLPAALTSAMS